MNSTNIPQDKDMSQDLNESIAIIGMVGRFPGAADLETFWKNLEEGKESITFFSDEELLSQGVAPSLLQDPAYVKAGGVLEGVELFDASFFGYTPKEAEAMDPQHRLCLEAAWQLLETAGYNSELFPGLISVFVGAGMSTYLPRNLMQNQRWLESSNDLQLLLGNNKDFVPTKISYQLNLQGPSVNVNTACSTALVAVHLACQNLLDYHSDMALAGGVGIQVPQQQGYLFTEGGIGSPDGHCRAFDARAQGTVGGSGLGLVLLKRAEDAYRDGDQIHALIRGSAINNDGANKIGFTAPSVEGQSKVILEAFESAGVHPSEISYLEAHGTGTPMGDPIEIEALRIAFQKFTTKKQFCALGSVKSNIGHLDEAAGMAGLIKTVLAMQHKTLPPSLHFQEPNPKIDFASSPFLVVKQAQAWPSSDRPRLAGVSSFGLGGTNAHLILQEAPPQEKSGPARQSQLITLSAKTETALQKMQENLRSTLDQSPAINLADMAYTLNVGRRSWPYRSAFAFDTRQELSAKLDEKSSGLKVPKTPEIAPALVFLFPGQGSQYAGMAKQLYEQQSLFRELVDEIAEKLLPLLGLDLRLLLLSPEGSLSISSLIHQTKFTQPAIFTFEYALAKLWQSWGITPTAMIGHSIGEYVAACLAEVFTLEEALQLVVARGQLMDSLPSGSMLSLPLTEEAVQPWLSASISLAAVNAPLQSVVSGKNEDIKALAKKLESQGIEGRILKTSHAFHSQMMDPILDSFREKLQSISLQEPSTPFISNVTGDWVQDTQVTCPDYWVNHLRQAVRFEAGLGKILEKGDSIFLEVGAGQTLSGLLKRHAQAPDSKRILCSLPAQGHKNSNNAVLLHALGKMWQEGLAVNWQAFYQQEKRQRIALPTYPFQRQRYWVTPDRLTTRESSIAVETSMSRTEIYLPTWSVEEKTFNKPLTDSKQWLLFIDTPHHGAGLERWLQKQNQKITVVYPGEWQGENTTSEYYIDAQEPGDYQRLMDALRKSGTFPDHIVHLWSLSKAVPEITLRQLHGAQESAFYSILYLIQALETELETHPLELSVFSNNLQEVIGGDCLCPEKATLLGLIKTIAQEFPKLQCRLLDLDFTESSQGSLEQPALWYEELSEPPSAPIVAYRNGQRWLPQYQQKELDSTEEIKLLQGAAYLISGGLGGMGLEIAKYLAKNSACQLILVNRTAFPSREQWPEILKTKTGSPKIQRGIQAIQNMEKQGAKVHLFTADVADLGQMKGLLTEVESSLGKVRGVIHAAGIADGGLLIRREKAQNEKVFAPKITGTWVLDQLFKEKPLDFFVLCSALSSISGAWGQAGYCAANAFQDAFAHFRNRRRPGKTLAINWDAWRETGMAFDSMQENKQARSENSGAQISLDHCLFTGYQQADETQRDYFSCFQVESTWFLREHRIDGLAVLPGTVYLELARAAFEHYSSLPSFELREVYFFSPLTLADDQSVTLRTRLVKQDEGYHFIIESQKDQEKNLWQAHAQGELFPLAPAEPKYRDLKQLQESLTAEVSSSRLEELQARFGPHWHNLRSIRKGEQEGLACLQLPAAWIPELDQLKLHPALMDMATGFLALQGNYQDGLPFSYKKIRYYQGLSPQVYAAARLHPPQDAGDKSLKFDLTLMDTSGRILVEIEEYCLRSERGNQQQIQNEEENFSLQLGAAGDLQTLKPIPVPRQDPGEDQLEIQVCTAGLNFKEVLYALGMLPLPDSFQFHFGLECAGIVSRVGGKVSRFQVGDAVIAFAPASFSRYTLTSEDSVVHKPTNLNFAEAATIPAAFMTAYYSLVTLGRLQKGERILIHSAAGGVGLAALIIAKWIGAEVLATAGNPEKRDFLRAQGASCVMDSRSLTFVQQVQQHTQGKGVDLVLNSLGGEFITKSLSLLAPFGRFLELGIRDIAADTPLGMGALEKNIAFFVVGLGVDIPQFPKLFAKVTGHLAAGDFKPIPYRTYPLEKVSAAFQWMSRAKHIGKIVIEIDGSIEKTRGTQQDKIKDPKNGLETGLSNQEGIEIFHRLLHCSHPQIIVSTQNLNELLEQTKTSQPQLSSGEHQAHPRPELQTLYQAPQNEVEKQLVETWQELLGIQPVGRQDNFFELGGDSLLATQINTRVRKLFPVEITLGTFFDHPTIAEQAEQIIIKQGQEQQLQLEIIPKLAQQETYELSHAQRRVWLASQQRESSIAYNMPTPMILEGPVDPDILFTSFEQVVERHEALRTIFLVHQGEARQKILSRVSFSFTHLDLRNHADPEQAARRLAREEAIRPFDLEQAPLFRMGLVQLAAERYLLLFTTHHIINDGTSLAVILKEWEAFYQAKLEGVPCKLLPLPFQYKDFDAWQNNQLQSPASAVHRDYWLKKMAHPLPQLELPLDAARPARKTYRGKVVFFRLNEQRTEQLSHLNKKQGVSLFVTLTACLNLLLNYYTEEEDLILGTPTTGRTHPQLQDQVGYFLDTLPLRNQINNEMSFDGFLRQVQKNVAAAFDHQAFPFDQLVEDLKLAPAPDRSPLFDVMLILQNTEKINWTFGQAKLLPFFEDPGVSKYDLLWEFVEEPQGLLVSIGYNSDLFKHERILAMRDDLSAILDKLFADPTQSIGEIKASLMTSKEKLNRTHQLHAFQTINEDF